MNCEICDAKMPELNTSANRICDGCGKVFHKNILFQSPNAFFLVIGLLLIVLILFSINTGFL
jgi:hypothetical protein